MKLSRQRLAPTTVHKRRAYWQRVKSFFGSNLISLWTPQTTADTTAKDLVNAHNGVLHSMAFVSGMDGSLPAWNLNGTTSFVDVASVIPYFNKAEGSIWVWCKIPSAVWADGLQHYLFCFRTDGNNQIRVSKQPTNDTLGYACVANSVGLGDTVLYKNTNWFSVCLTWSNSGNSSKLYINNVLSASGQFGAWVGEFATDRTCLGAYSTGANYVHSGYLQYVSLYSKALSDSDRTFLQNNSTDRQVIVAASDSSAGDKAAALYVCDGTADNVEIQAALNNTKFNRITLAEGTFTLANSNLYSRANTILEGAGINSTTINVAAVVSTIFTVGTGSVLRDIKFLGSGVNSREVLAGNNSTIQRIWISHNGYGVDTTGITGVTISDLTCDNIHDTPGWAAAFHAGQNTNGVTVTNLVATDCDRGSEIENGAQNVTVSGFTFTRINNTTCDVHTHNGYLGCVNITYKNGVLDTYSGFSVAGVVGALSNNITLENITATNNQGLPDGTPGLNVDLVDGVSITNVNIVNPGSTRWGISIFDTNAVTIHSASVTGADTGKAWQAFHVNTNLTGTENIVVS